MSVSPSKNNRRNTVSLVVIDTDRVKSVGDKLEHVSTREATRVADRELRPLLSGRQADDDLGYIVAGVDASGDKVEKDIDRSIKTLARFCKEAVKVQRELDSHMARTYSEGSQR